MKKFLILYFLFTAILLSQSATHYCSLSKIKNFERLNKTNKINYPGDSRFDVTYYKLDLHIDYNQTNITGAITVKAKSIEDNLSEIFLDLQNQFDVDSVISNGNLLANNLNDSKLNITLDKTYNSGEEFELTVYYNGTPGSSGFGSFEFSTHNEKPIVWSLSEPYGASDWWPCKDTPADKADSADIWITADSMFVSVSNGTLEAVTDNGDGTKTYKWKNHHPIAQYLISVAMTNYTIYENSFVYSGGAMKVVHYVFPEQFNDKLKEKLDLTVQALEVFSDLFGLYPYIDEKYGHAQFGWGGGMEHQTVSSMGSFGQLIVTHELAHQWFGDKVTCKDWHHIWLNEGFASYSEALFVEQTQDKQAYFNYVAGQMERARNAVGSIYVQDISSVGQIFDGNRSYAKGSVVLHMLRNVVGDTSFFNILKTYLNDPALSYNVAVTEDFQRVCEEVSGIDLDYFFSEWIYGEDYPKYTIDWSSEKKQSGYGFKITISQQQHSNPEYFIMPVQVRITGSGKDTLVTLFNTQNNQTFEYDLSFEPLSIRFDPDNWILKEVQNITNIDEGNTPVVFSLSQNYPNPFNPVTTIQYSLPLHSSHSQGAKASKGFLVTLKVYNILGKEVTTLVNKEQKSGTYKVQFDASNLSSGTYFYQLKWGGLVDTKKMTVIK